MSARVGDAPKTGEPGQWASRPRFICLLAVQLLAAQSYPPLHPTLLATVLYRETPIGKWFFDRTGLVPVTLNIGANLIAGDARPCFHFRITDPRLPAETGGSADIRPLGLGFKSLRLQRLCDRPSAGEADAAGVNRTGSGSRPRSFHRRLNAREAFIAEAIRVGRRVLPNIDLDVLWEDMWIFRVGDCYFPLPEVTEPEEWRWRELAGAATRYLQRAEDNWYRVYRPKLGDVVVDMGAGRGEDTYAFSRAVGDSGRVIAMEPHPVSFGVLSKFCLWNRLSNVTVLNLACADKAGELRIETSSKWAPDNRRGGEAPPTGFMVDAVPFDRIWETCRIGRIDFLKMNIPGAERLALMGCRRALMHTRNISVAAHDHRADRAEAEWLRTGDFVRRFLRDSGFHLVPHDDPRPWACGYIHGMRPESE